MQGLTTFDSMYDILSKQQKRDFIVPKSSIQAVFQHDDFSLDVPTNGHSERFGINKTGHEQIASELKIPKDYYNRMREEHPVLWENSVNTWLRSDPKRKMVRVLNNDVRALLSDRYQRIDHFDLAGAALPIFSQLQTQSGITLRDCGLTDNSMYVKASFPKIRGEVKVGDVVEAAIVISNSEIGKASAKVEAMTYRLVCSNGMITSQGKRRHHIGALYGDSGDIDRYLTDETCQKTDQAIIAQFRDTITGLATDTKWFESEIAKMQNAAEDVAYTEITELPQKGQKALGLSDKETGLLMASLLQNSGQFASRWDFANAVTNTAQKVEVYDRRVELERIGGDLIATKAVWNKFSN